jgi:protein-S-isoprenylcysteine O-methyltransferase Ste14
MNLELKIPPLALTLVFAIGMLAVSRFLPAYSFSHLASNGLSLLLVVIGAFFCVYGILEFRRSKTTVDPRFPNNSSSLVTNGVYSISRNPMYLGFSLFLCALAVFLKSPYLLFGVAAFVLYMNRFQILPEERALEAHFGDSFLAYKNTVRRWM